MTCVEGYWEKMPEWRWWRSPNVPNRWWWRSQWDRPGAIWKPGGWCKWSQVQRTERPLHHEPRSPLFPESRKWEKTLPASCCSTHDWYMQKVEAWGTWKVATTTIPKQEINPSARAAIFTRRTATFVPSFIFSTYLKREYTVAVPACVNANHLTPPQIPRV